MLRQKRGTPKTGGNGKRVLVKRNLPATPGADNLIVTRSGESLRAILQSRLEKMGNDLKKVEFYWKKSLSDPTFSETREYPEHSKLVSEWELCESVKTLAEYKARMKRFEVLIDHFKPDHDYELTLSETVEIES